MKLVWFWIMAAWTAAITPVAPQMTEVNDVRLTIFLYHHVKPGRHDLNVRPEIFEAQLKHLRDEGFTTVTMSQLLAAFKGEERLPPKTVALTFDDTLANQYRYAFPLLKRYGMTATFFVSSEVVGERSAMTWEQVREMRDAGMDFGSHGRWHPWLTRLSDGRLKRELTRSKRDLELGLGRPVLTFAYPFGAQDARVREATRAAGYELARGVKSGQQRGLRQRHDLRCFDPTDSLSGFVRRLPPTTSE